MGDANPGFVPLQQKNMAMHRNRSPNEQASLAFARRRVYHPECDQPSHEEMLEIAQQDGFTDFDEASKEYYLCAYKAHPEMEELMETYSTYTATMHFDFVSGALKATRYKKSDANLLLSKVQKLLAEFYSVCSTQILQVLKECKFDTSWAESLLRDDAFVFMASGFGLQLRLRVRMANFPLKTSHRSCVKCTRLANLETGLTTTFSLVHVSLSNKESGQCL